jgi:hypothetical protein
MISELTMEGQISLKTRAARHTVAVILGALAGFALTSMAAWGNPGRWTVETMASGLYAEMKLDSQDRPHIAWEPQTGVLKYGVRDNGTWVEETVDGDLVRFRNNNRPFSFALSPNGVPGIVYTKADGFWYAAGGPGGWTHGTIPELFGEVVDYDVSLNLSDAPGVTFADSSAGTELLKFAEYSDGSWNLETISTISGDYDWRIASSVDSLDRRWIAWNPPQEIRCSVQTGGSWHDIVMASFSQSNLLSNIGLALDRNDNPHIAVSYQSIFGTQGFNYQSVPHVERTIMSDHMYIYSLGLDLTSIDIPGAAFVQSSGGLLKLARRSDNSGLSWSIQTLAQSSGFGREVSFGFDSRDNPHILYIDGEMLKFVSGYPSYSSAVGSGDYNGDGTADLAVFRDSNGSWLVQGVTRVYFGASTDSPVPSDYDGDATTDIGIFRDSSGLWSVRNLTRFYFGSSLDAPAPVDYDGNNTAEAGIFRGDSGLWSIRGVTRVYFGTSGDIPVPGHYDSNTIKDIAVFRPSSGMWSAKNVTRFIFGSSFDDPVPGDYTGDGTWEGGIFRPTATLWAIRDVTRVSFGNSNDWALPADFNGDGTDDTGVFRPSAGLWAIRNLTQVYFGSTGDIPVTR